MRRFSLEHEYRLRYTRDQFDLASSSPQPLTARDVLAVAGLDHSTLFDTPLDYERGGGDRDLRNAVAALYDGITGDDVLITAGASEGIRVALTAAIHPGDRVVVQQPAYAALNNTSFALGADVLPWRSAGGFQFDFASLTDESGTATAIIFNNPHGPSGSAVLGDYSGGARLICDEVYRPVASSGRAVASVVNSDLRAVSIGDLSKPLGLGGLRIGWIVSRDRQFINECTTALDYFSGSVSALSARIALAAISRFDTHLDRHIARARRNLRALTTFVEQHASWLDWMPPQAGYTAFLHLRDGSGAGALRARMAERGIFLLDGSVFESPDHLRIGFGLEEAAFGRALAVFGEELRDLTPSPTPAHASPSGDVILLAKDPSLGRAKTRLARDIGEEYAGELCTAFVRDSIALATKHARRLYLSFAPAEALATFQALAPRARCFAQPEAEFGTRLLHAFETAINDGARQPVLIGTDSPSLPSHLLDAAQRALLAHDVVIGPAEDGGYYLIGMNAPLAALFEDIDWSTDRVLSQTLNRVQSAGLSVFLLPHWYDVDTGGDLEQLAGDPLLGDHTRAALKMHRREEVAV